MRFIPGDGLLITRSSDHRIYRSRRSPDLPLPSPFIPYHPSLAWTSEGCIPMAPATRAFRVAGQKSSQFGVDFSDHASIGAGFSDFRAPCRRLTRAFSASCYAVFKERPTGHTSPVG